MSVQALSWVFDHSPTTGAERLVMLSLANHAGTNPVDEAWECWPGIELIQREAGLADERTTRRVLGRLDAAGHIERKFRAAPDRRIRADRRTNLYRILCHIPDGGVSETPPSEGVSHAPPSGHEGVSHAPRGGFPCTYEGVSQTPQTVSEPSIKPSVSQSGDNSKPDCPVDSTDGPTDSRLDKVAAILGAEDHAAAIAAGISIKHRPRHLAACVEQWYSPDIKGVLTHLAATLPDATPEELAAALRQPAAKPSSNRDPGVDCPRCEGRGTYEIPGPPDANHSFVARCDPHLPPIGPQVAPGSTETARAL